MAKLRDLSIPYPANDAPDAIWYQYLVNLAALSRAGNLDGARRMYQHALEGTDLSQLE